MTIRIKKYFKLLLTKYITKLDCKNNNYYFII
jgi:hypothetical protein